MGIGRLTLIHLALLPIVLQGQALGAANLASQLDAIRDQVLGLQKELLIGGKAKDEARSQVRKIQALLKLQKREREIAGLRMQELEKTVGDLESRRTLLNEKISLKREQVRARMRSLGSSMLNGSDADRKSVFLDEREGWDAVARQIQAGIAKSSVREIEELKVDLEDARLLEGQINEERQQLTYLFQDIQEQESVLELNQQIQMDLVRKEHKERLAQLENYRRLKSAEANVQKMLVEFNARRELQKQVEADRARSRVARALEESLFARKQGALPLPVRGRIVGKFGKALDPQSKLQVFKKGIEIEVAANSPVSAVASGKVAFAGDLPGYGRVLILDHGDHYYTLCGNLKDIARRTGDSVESGDLVGHSGSGAVYFEIRSRNIAVNPLQWVASSFSLNP